MSKMQIMKKSNNPTSEDTKKLKQKLSVLQQEQRQLKTFLNITQIISSELDLTILLQKIAKQVQDLLDADRCTLFLYDDDNNELWSRVATGVEGEIRFPSDKGIAGHVFQSGEIMNIPDAYKDSRFNKEIDKKTGYKTKNMLTLPMRNNREEVIGVFQVLNRKSGPFTKKSEAILSAIAQISASSIENAQLHEQQKKSFVSFVEALATTLDTRDYITAGHTRRVTLYTLEIGRLMKLDNLTMEVLRYAALLHDIGKIGVPEIVLFKDRKLSEDEYDIIKGHAQITKNILEKIHFDKEFKNIPLIASSHHERLDGSGYPQGLKGDEIALEARIMAVADVFDALTSRRQYQDRMDLEKVLQVIDTETGTSFEPFVVYQFKFISLDRLIRIMEYGHTDEIDSKDLEKVREFTLKDMAEIRSKTNKSDTELEIENVFMRYYLRQYRTS
jgi:putative nucleotidyltransferase with HDIG domain